MSNQRTLEIRMPALTVYNAYGPMKYSHSDICQRTNKTRHHYTCQGTGDDDLRIWLIEEAIECKKRMEQGGEK